MFIIFPGNLLSIIFNHLNHLFFVWPGLSVVFYWWYIETLKVKDEAINLNVNLKLSLHLIFQEVWITDIIAIWPWLHFSWKFLWEYIRYFPLNFLRNVFYFYGNKNNPLKLSLQNKWCMFYSFIVRLQIVFTCFWTELFKLVRIASIKAVSFRTLYLYEKYRTFTTLVMLMHLSYLALFDIIWF